MKNSFSDAHPFTQLIFSLFIILVCFLLSFLFAILIAIPVFNIGFAELTRALSDYNDPNNINFIKYLQTIQGIGLFVLPAFVIGYLHSKKTFKYLSFNRINPRSLISLTFFVFVFSIPIISYTGYLNSKLVLPEWMSGIENWMQETEDRAKAATMVLLKMDSIGALLFNLFMIAIIPAIGEELIFRGVFQKIIGNWAKNMHIGIIISAFLFSAMHFQFYGFLPRLLLGILLGYIFYWSGTIWIPILGHFINNAAATISYYFAGDQVMESGENFATDTLPYLGISLALVTMLIFTFYKQSRLKVENS